MGEVGVLNKLRIKVTWASHPELNLTSSCIGRMGVRIQFLPFDTRLLDFWVKENDDISIQIKIHLLTTFGVTSAYKLRMEKNPFIGECEVHGDSSIHPPYIFTQCRIEAIENELIFNGSNPDWIVVITGKYNSNNDITY